MKEKAKDGFVDQLRSRLKASMRVCPTCSTAAMSQREVARAAGIDPATLCRFLAGKGPSAALVDKVVEYLGAEEGGGKKKKGAKG